MREATWQELSKTRSARSPSPGSPRTLSCCTRRWPGWPRFARRSATWKRPLVWSTSSSTNWRAHPILASAFWLIEVAYALVPLGRGAELEEGLGRIKARSQWAEAARAYVSEDFTAAADILAEIGSKPDEAYARLRSGNEADVRRALDFYRSVGATRYLDEGESMLATSRSA